MEPNLESDHDELLRLAASNALRSRGYGLAKLQCEVSAGVVTLSGAVPSFFLKQMAQEAVLRMAHVREVRNLVQVRSELLLPPHDIDPSLGNDIGSQ